MSIPYIGFGNDTLSKLPVVKKGDEIHCPRCNERHLLWGADDGSELIMFYDCGGKTYLGAVNGRLVVHQKPDASGSL